MPLKPCLKSGRYKASSCYNSNNHPPIPFDSTPPSYDEYSALPYAQPFVHFPPSPTLTSTHVVDDSRIYDRTPIVVAQNDCALPQRGCPGRTYVGVERPLTRKSVASGNHAHPSATRFSNCNLPPPDTSTYFLSLRNEEASSEDSEAAFPTPPEYRPTSLPGALSPMCHSLCKPDHHSVRCPSQQPSLCLSNANDLLSQPPTPTHVRRALMNPIVAPSCTSSKPLYASRLSRGTTTFASALDSSCLGGF